MERTTLPIPGTPLLSSMAIAGTPGRFGLEKRLAGVFEHPAPALPPKVDPRAILRQVVRSRKALAGAAASIPRLRALVHEIDTLRARNRANADALEVPAQVHDLLHAGSFETFCALLPGIALDHTYADSHHGRTSCFPLVWALSAREHPLELVRLMLAAGARADLTTGLGDTVLHDMAAMNRSAAVRFPILLLLLLAGADLEARNLHGETPLSIAVAWGSLEDLGYFLAAGARVRRRDLEQAARHPAKLRLLLTQIAAEPASHADPTAIGGWLRCQIAEWRQKATGIGHSRAARMVTDLSQSLAMIAELPGYEPPDALHRADWQIEPAAFFSLRTAPTLEDFRQALAGVRLDSFDDRSDHPVYWPLRAADDRVERLRLMLEAGASVQGVPGEGTALHVLAIEHRGDADEQERLARMIVAVGADLEAERFDGRTPLACAVATRGLTEASALLRLGADPDATITWRALCGTHFRAPILFVAAECPRMFRLLLDHGADPGQRDAEGRSLSDYLHEAVADHRAALDQAQRNATPCRALERTAHGLAASLSILRC